jgi:2-methylisocitrate lyase-like PEP mutase family enzyme
MNGAKKLRSLLQAENIIAAPGVYDGMTACLVEQAGFPAAYMTGAGTSASKGYPDFGLLTLTEMVENAGVITRSIDIPLISDADTGYGNELNVTRTVGEFERRGVATIHIEDQVAPKRCGHLDGKEVVSREEFVIKIEAAVAARRNPDFVIIARTDARAVIGFEEAIARANAAIAAGADMAFVEAVQTVEEMVAVPQLVRAPCLLNMVAGGKTPPISIPDAQAQGYRLAIVPGAVLGPVIRAADEALRKLKEMQTIVTPKSGGGGGPMDIFRRFGADEWNRVRRISSARTRTTSDA